MRDWKNAIYGLAIGDAMGVPYEFRSRGTFNCSKMIGYGTHNQPRGTWSDDTAMTLATAKSIKDNSGRINISDIKRNFLNWMINGKFTIDDYVFDIGNTTWQALKKGKPCTDERSNGNGSLMRILPLAFIDCTDNEIRKVSAITHGHEIAMEACVIYVHIAKQLLNSEVLQLDYPKPFDRLKYIKDLSVNDIKSSGYVIDTLESSLWSLYHGRNLKDVILKAVNLGDDTDTTGAVAGGLAGIVYNVNPFLYRQLRGKDVIKSCI